MYVVHNVFTSNLYIDIIYEYLDYLKSILKFGYDIIFQVVPDLSLTISNYKILRLSYVVSAVLATSCPVFQAAFCLESFLS